jgi:hypothetical protein
MRVKCAPSKALSNIELMPCHINDAPSIYSALHLLLCPLPCEFWPGCTSGYLTVLCKKKFHWDTSVLLLIMAASLVECAKEEHRSVILFLWSEGVKERKVYGRMTFLYCPNWTRHRNFYEWKERFKRRVDKCFWFAPWGTIDSNMLRNTSVSVSGTTRRNERDEGTTH